MDKKILEEEIARSRTRILKEAEERKEKQQEKHVRKQLKAEGLLPISRRVYFRHDAKTQRSVIEASGGAGLIQLKIFTKMPPQARRAIGASLIRSMKPILKYLRNFQILHDGDWLSLPRLEARGLPLTRSPDLDTEQGRIGFEIRMKRLKIGWTQQELADRASMDFRHLSRIELGTVKARAKALDKIHKVLNSMLDPPEQLDAAE